MSKPYSDDLGIRAVSAVAGDLSRHKASEVFSVGVSSVIRWVQKHDQTGSVSPKPMGGSRGTRIEGADRGGRARDTPTGDAPLSDKVARLD